MRHLTREQVREIDRRATEEFGLSGLVLMENAGRGCADLLCRLGISGKVVICCGQGNNAGDGFVIARHLELRGKDVQILFWGEPEKLPHDASLNRLAAAKAGIPLVSLGAGVVEGTSPPFQLSDHLTGCDWVVDALLGTGAEARPNSPLNAVIDLLNLCDARKFAVDIPSGLDANSGAPSNATFRADHTATFVAPKIGFLSPSARAYLGLVHVLDIGAPKKLIDESLAAGQEA